MSEFTSIIQYIQMYSGTGYISKLELILKSFSVTLWIIHKLYENGTSIQCTLSISTLMHEKEGKTCWGGGRK